MQEEGAAQKKRGATLRRLHELADTPARKRKPLEIDDDLERFATDIIPGAVETLHRARLTKATNPIHAANPKVGRNDPCPCGSDKKFKKCCLH